MYKPMFYNDRLVYDVLNMISPACARGAIRRAISTP